MKGDGYRQPISFDFFIKVAENPNEQIATVSRKGFERYEGGAMGFGWIYCYFKDKEDYKLYKKYIKEHPEFRKRNDL